MNIEQLLGIFGVLITLMLFYIGKKLETIEANTEDILHKLDKE